MTEIKFGFWPRSLTLDTSTVHVEPLPDFETVVERIKRSDRAGTRWFYPPLTAVYEPGREEGDVPLIYAGAYALPPTHLVRVSDTDGQEFGELIITLLGLLEGIRLVPEQWSHFYRASIEPHSLVDFVANRRDIEHVLHLAQCFWGAHSAQEVRRGMFGAIHWLLFSQSYEHQFEEFSGQYIVLDACYKLHCDVHGPPSVRPTHATRPSYLARYYSIPEPAWASIRADGACDLSELRNQFFHEGRYGGQPIGFAHPTNHPSIVLELTAFNTRLLLGILGLDCGYVRSAVDTRQMHGLDLP